MLQHSRHHAPQLWLGGSPWEVQRQGKLQHSQITKHACLSYVLVSCQTRRTDGCCLVLTSPLLTHWELIAIKWTYSSYRLQLTRTQADSQLRISTVMKQSWIVNPAVYCTVLNSRWREIHFSIPRNFLESRVSRVLLTSLLQYLLYIHLLPFLIHKS